MTNGKHINAEIINLVETENRQKIFNEMVDNFNKIEFMCKCAKEGSYIVNIPRKKKFSQASHDYLIE